MNSPCNFRFENGRRFVSALYFAGNGDAQLIEMFRDNLYRTKDPEKCIDIIKSHCEKYKFHLAVRVFNWKKSPEGYEFWQEIYTALKDYKIYERRLYEIEANKRDTYKPKTNKKTKNS